MVVPLNYLFLKRFCYHQFSIFAEYFCVFYKKHFMLSSLKRACRLLSLCCCSAISLMVRGNTSSSSLQLANTRFMDSKCGFVLCVCVSFLSAHQRFVNIIQFCLSSILLQGRGGVTSNLEIASATVLSIPFM